MRYEAIQKCTVTTAAVRYGTSQNVRSSSGLESRGISYMELINLIPVLPLGILVGFVVLLFEWEEDDGATDLTNSAEPSVMPKCSSDDICAGGLNVGENIIEFSNSTCNLSTGIPVWECYNAL